MTKRLPTPRLRRYNPALPDAPANHPGLSRLRGHIRRMGLAYLIFLISLFPAAIVSSRVHYNLQSRDQDRLNALVAAQREHIDRHFGEVAQMLNGVRGLFLANHKIRPTEWNLFLDSIGFTESATGFRDLGFARRVQAAELPSHVAEMTGIREDYSVEPPSQRAEYFPIIFMRDKDAGNFQGFGWDPYSSPIRRAAMDRARDTGFATCTDKFLMTQPGTNQKIEGHVLYLPIFIGSIQPASVEERREMLAGFVFASFRSEQIWAAILPRAHDGPLVDFEIFEGNNPSNLIFDAYPDRPPGSARRTHTLAMETPLRYFGQRWTMRVSTLEAFETVTPHYVVGLVIAGCIAISLTLFSIAVAQARHSETAVQLAENLRKEKLNEESLLQSQARLKLLNNILGLMAAGSEPMSIVARTVEELARNLPNYRVVFSTAREHGEWLPVCSAGALPSVKGHAFSMAAAPQLLDWIRDGRAIVSGHLAKDERFAPLRREKYFAGAGAVLEQPVRHGPKFAGLLSFHSPRPREWTSDETIMLHEIADYLTAAYMQYDGAERRRQAEAALQGEKERLRVTLGSIADGVITTDTSGNVLLLNRAAESMTGWSEAEAAGRHIREIFPALDEKSRAPLPNPAEIVLGSGGVSDASLGLILLARDGTERTVAESAAAIRDQNSRVIGAALVFRDITERRRLQKELLKASKLESVGLLAGGIAHDFNNILSVVLGNVSLCKMLAPPVGAFAERLEQAEKGCLRARELTQQLLTFAKGGSPIRKAASIVEIVHESTAFACRGSNIVCENEASSNLWPVEVDEGQISQVFNNLVINAVQAMPDGGTLRTTMENCEIADGSALHVAPGRFVHITVKDTGAGIQRENLGRIFDPYFTTKKGGSGLGLATAYAIIQKHQGNISVESAEGQGTTFHIYLPASQSQIAPKVVEAAVAPSGGGRLLVMDDETAILDLARASLRHLGYEVETARHGGEAIEKFQAAAVKGEPFAAVIMDLTVPGGMGGREAMKRLLEIDPAVRAIVSSGYSQDPVMANFRDYGFSGVVEKPYQIKDLARTLDQILHESQKEKTIGAEAANGSQSA